MNSSLRENLLSFLETFDRKSSNNTSEESASWNDSSIPSLEDFIIGLADKDKSYQNPFQLTDDVKNEIMRQTEATGSRAMNWSMGSFDRMGGKNTLRSVWARLKSDNRVRGSKRTASSSCSSSPVGFKRLKRSLGISSTRDEFDKINLDESSSSNGSNLLKCLSIDEVFRGDDDSTYGEYMDMSVRERDLSGRESVWEHGQLDSSGSIPQLTSSDTDSDPGLVSTDSGRSDTWTFTGGIVHGVRELDERDVEHGVVTVTGPDLAIVNGFTNDGVVTGESSSEMENSPGIRMPVSTTTDEGMGSQVSWSAYIDDEVIVGLEYNAVENGAVLGANANDHGRPGIAGIQGRVRRESGLYDRDYRLLSEGHGRPSIAGIQWEGVGEIVVGVDDSSPQRLGHGGPSIASNQDDDSQSDCHGRPSIAGLLSRDSYQYDGDSSSQSDDVCYNDGHGRPGIAGARLGGVGDQVVGVSSFEASAIRGQPVQGIWDSPCDGDLGGGPRVYQRQVTTVPVVNDDSEGVIDPESGHGMSANGREVGDGQANGLIGGPGR